MPDPTTLMRLALEQAHLALSLSEVPIGCVICHVPTNRILASTHNRRHLDQDPTAHAEILALKEAAKQLNSWRLLDCTLVVTLEPCPMCAGAIVNARIPTLIYGTNDPKAGAVRTLYQLCDDPKLNHRVQITEGILANECAALLQQFFQQQRAMGKK